MAESNIRMQERINKSSDSRLRAQLTHRGLTEEEVTEMDRAELKETVAQLEGVQQREAEFQPPEDQPVFGQPDEDYEIGPSGSRGEQVPGYALLQLKWRCGKWS